LNIDNRNLDDAKNIPSGIRSKEKSQIDERRFIEENKSMHAGIFHEEEKVTSQYPDDTTDRIDPKE
jgi:hypothetical protein